ncbi:MAG: YlbF family regulator [Gemmatimonadota bacterium]
MASTNDIEIPTAVAEALTVLSANIVASAAFLRHEDALEAIRSDPEAMELLTGLEQAQERVQGGRFEAEDLRTLENIQQRVRAHPALMEYFRTQQDAVAFLREINREVTTLLSLDFAQMAGTATC